MKNDKKIRRGWIFVLVVLFLLSKASLFADVDEFTRLPAVSPATIVGEWQAIRLPGVIYYLRVQGERRAQLVISPVGGKAFVCHLSEFEVRRGDVKLGFKGLAEVEISGTGVAGSNEFGDLGILNVQMDMTPNAGETQRYELVFTKTELVEGLCRAMRAAKEEIACLGEE